MEKKTSTNQTKLVYINGLSPRNAMVKSILELVNEFSELPNDTTPEDIAAFKQAIADMWEEVYNYDITGKRA